MIHAIGEATIQKTIRSSVEGTDAEKAATQQKAHQVRQQRPVEKSDEGRRAEPDRKDHGQEAQYSRHLLEEGQIVVERYDKSGRLIRKSPPGYVPFGEIA